MQQDLFCPFELESSWKHALADELQKPYIAQLAAFVEKERRLSPKPIYPPAELVFNALLHTPLDKVRVVIIGQDPYHGPGQAHGLAFSVQKGVPLPQSLQNIFKEMKEDVGIPTPNHGCLTSWADQGILLLNATLTVREGEPLSHHGKGWETFTDAIVNLLIAQEKPLVFVLWGNSAQQKCRQLNAPGVKHVVLTAPHPSPLSAYKGFLGSKPFSSINAILEKWGEQPINWEIK